MRYTNSLKSAILSEKAHNLMKMSTFTLLVDKKATKEQIARDVERQFSTKVQKVNVASLPLKKKRVGNTRRFTNVKSGRKKAIVYLQKGENIAMLMPKSSQKKTKEKDKKEENKKGK